MTMINYILRTLRRKPSNKRILAIQNQNIHTGPRFDKYFMESAKESDQSLRSPISWKILGFTVVLSGSLLLYVQHLKSLKNQRLEKERKRQIGKASIGGTFELLNSEGKLVKSEDFLGKWLLIYFGFTHCPDICPDEIEKMSLVVEELENKNIVLAQPLFITVDPSRDTPEVVGKYVKEFSDKIVGLSGSPEQIAKVCKNYRVYHSSAKPDEDNDYIVDHTIIIYLVDPDGNFVDYYLQSHDANAMVNSITLNKNKYDSMKNESIFSSINLKNITQFIS